MYEDKKPSIASHEKIDIIVYGEGRLPKDICNYIKRLETKNNNNGAGLCLYKSSMRNGERSNKFNFRLKIDKDGDNLISRRREFRKLMRPNKSY